MIFLHKLTYHDNKLTFKFYVDIGIYRYITIHKNELRFTDCLNRKIPYKKLNKIHTEISNSIDRTTIDQEIKSVYTDYLDNFNRTRKLKEFLK